MLWSRRGSTECEVRKSVFEYTVIAIRSSYADERETTIVWGGGLTSNNQTFPKKDTKSDINAIHIICTTTIFKILQSVFWGQGRWERSAPRPQHIRNIMTQNFSLLVQKKT